MQNYHCHHYFSNLNTSFKDSAMSYEDYAKRAEELNQQIITSVDHGVQGNYFKCWETAQAHGLKFVYGVEAYWVRDRKQEDKTNAHIVLLAKNKPGIWQINEILSTANEDGYYHVPRVDVELLKKLNPENVLITTACVAFWGKVDKATSDVNWHYESKENILELFHQLREHFGDSLMLEVQCHNTKWQKQVNLLCRDLHDQYQIPYIAGMDSHYIYPSQKQERQWLREESGVKMGDEDHEFANEVYEDYPDEETFVQRFRTQGVLTEEEIQEAIDNTDTLLFFDDIDFDRSRKLPTIYPELTQEERNQKYVDLVMDGWEKFKQGVPCERWQEYLESFLKEEVEVITSTNMSDYFLLDHDMVQLGIQNGGYVTRSGRGSSGSFFTNTLLGMSTLDRFDLPVSLYPARFCTAERLKSSCPDLDLNVSDPAIFAEAQEELLGKGHSYPMIAYGTLKKKSAFKLYARTKNLPMDVANRVSAQIEEYEDALKNADDDDERELIQIEDYVDKEYLSYIEASKPYNGIVVSKSQSPCSYLLYNGDIRSEIGIMRVNANGGKKIVYCTVCDGYTAEAFGYVKNDILPVKVIAINAEAMNRAGLPQLTSKELIDLTKNDKATWDILAKGYTQGINQCQGEGTTNKLMMYKPRSLQDMAAFVAAIRPGFKSMAPKFLHREKFSYGIPSFDALLKNDSGGSSWMLYQEDIMKCMGLAGFNLDETYPVIKAISKKKVKVIEAAKPRFLTGFAEYVVKNDGLSEEEAQRCSELVWQIIMDSAQYSFNACVSGSTKLFQGNDKQCELTVEEMYRMHERDGMDYGSTYSMFENGAIKRNSIIDVREAGIRKTYRVVTESGAELVCTDNHRFPTQMGKIKLENLEIGEPLYVVKRKKPGKEEYLSTISPIKSIEFVREEMTYNIEMKDPAHNFVSESGLVSCNSHAVAVAIDALYGAYLKAHYPYEYYTTLLDSYTKDGNKKKVSLIRSEMRKSFGITISPCRYRQDNRKFLILKEKHAVADALTSIKSVGKRAAEDLYALKDRHYDSFVDLLMDLQNETSINSKVRVILIRSGYFEEFGKQKKLLAVHEEFVSGKNRITKSLVPKTIEKRMAALREFERNCPDEDESDVEKLAFETEYCGVPISVFPNQKKIYSVLEVNDAYSPKIKLYSASTGNVNTVKVKKADYQNKKLTAGDVISMNTWRRKPACSFIDGKRVPKPGVFDIWMDAYDILYRKGESQ